MCPALVTTRHHSSRDVASRKASDSSSTACFSSLTALAEEATWRNASMDSLIRIAPDELNRRQRPRVAPARAHSCAVSPMVAVRTTADVAAAEVPTSVATALR